MLGKRLLYVGGGGRGDEVLVIGLDVFVFFGGGGGVGILRCDYIEGEILWLVFCVL